MQRSTWRSRFVNGRVYTDNALPRFDGGGGLVQNSGVIVDDSNNVTGINSLTSASITLSGFTEGSVIYAGASGVLSQENTQLHWDASRNSLGLGYSSGLDAKLKIRTGYEDYPVNPASLVFVASEDNDGYGNYDIGTAVQYKVYAYRTVAGVKVYSTEAHSTNYTLINAFGSLNVTFTGASGTVEGYKVWRAYAGSGFFVESTDIGLTTTFRDDQDLLWITDDIETGDPAQSLQVDTLLNYRQSASYFYGIYSQQGLGYLAQLGVGIVPTTYQLDVSATSKASRIVSTGTQSTLIIQGANNGGFATYSQLEVRNSSGTGMLFFGDSNSGSTSAGVLNFIGAGNSSGDYRGELTFINTNLGGDKRVSTWRVVQGAGGTSTSDFYILTRNSGFGYNIYGNYLLNNGFGGITAPTAAVHMRAGSATANTAPMRFTSGALLATPVVGTVEFLTDKWYGTITTGTARKEFALADIALTSGRVPFATTNGRLTDSANMTYVTNRRSLTYITLAAGTATAGTCPFVMTSGTLLSVAIAGGIEFLTDKFYGTITTGAARKEIALLDAAMTTSWLPFYTTNGRLTGSANATLSSTGILLIGGQFSNSLSAGSSGMLKLNGNTLTGTTQWSVDCATFTATSAATSLAGGILIGATTANSSFTCSQFANLYLQNITKGAASAITRRYGLYIEAPTGAGTGSASIADNNTAAASYFIHSTTTNESLISGDLRINTAGKGLLVKEGSNAKMGASTLVAGTVTVSTTAVTASSRIYLSIQSLGTVATAKAIAVTARTAATSFTITSEDATDTSVIAWVIVEPA